MSGVEVAYAVAAAGLAIAATSLLAPKGPTTEIGKLEDRGIQSSAYGEPINRFYGTITAPGNVIWLKGGKLDEHVKKKKQGGKGGGGGSTTKTYTYSGTFILGLGGPIAGVRRIWCLDKLIYNAGSDDLETIVASNQAANAWTIYTGTDDQMPDPDYEADVGVGNAPALRGMSYIKFKDFQLADYNNSLQGAQFKVEVVSGLSVDEGLSLFSTASTPVGVTPSNDGGAGRCVASVIFGSDGRSIVQSGSTYTSGSASGKLYSVLDGAAIPRGGFIADMSGAGSTNPIPGQSDADSYAIGGQDFVNIDGVKYSVDFHGAFHYLQNTRYIKSGGDVYIFDASFSEIYLFDAGTGAKRASLVVSGAVSVALEADGTLAVLLTSRSVATVAGDLSGILSTTDYGIPLQPFGPSLVNSAIRVDNNGVRWVIYRAEIYKLGTSSIDENYELPFVLEGKYNSYDFKYGLFAILNGETGELFTYTINAATGQLVPLSEIIKSEVKRSALVTVTDIDTSLITDQLAGYRVAGGTIRAALEQPQGAYPFDVIQSGYMIKCVPRGQSSVVTIPWEHLGANDSDESGDLITQSREMDSQLPAITAVSYLCAEREYATGEQIAQRINTAAVNRNDLELAMVLTDDKAAQVAEVLQGIAWLERTDFAITLPPIYLPLEPSDVITVQSKNAVYELRIVDVNYTPDGRLECKVKPNRAALYISGATGGTGITPPSSISIPGKSFVLLLDIPLVDEVSQNAVGFVSAMTGYNNGWPGAVLVRSADGGQTWEDLQAYTGKGGISFASTTLAAHDGYLIDQRSLLLNFISGEPESITRDQLLTGYNYAAYGVNGRWEIVRFQTATLNGDGSYSLSSFVRGDKGTEWATGLHQPGDFFVLLDDPDNAFIGTAVQTIGLARDYRAVTSGASVDDANNVSFTYNGVNLECLSPVNARATRDGSGNLSATFTRRSRLGSSWWGTGVEAPIGETTQAYEVDVMSGATLKRTISSATPAFSYSAADQTTDFGSAQASITFRIYQLSETVGRGYVREVTL
ncbi:MULTISPECIES: phage tail protein [Pseudomonas]|uniref:phage tail protein n=1 Tax=Pseudomonas TaxID=286 RepID=UPI003002C3C4